MPKPSLPPPLLPLRSLVILVAALCCGAIVGALTYGIEPSLAAAILAGLGAAGAVTAFLHQNIET